MFRRSKVLVELSHRWEFSMAEIAFPGGTIPCSIGRGICRWRSVLVGCADGDHAPRVGDDVVHIVLQNVGIYHMPVHPAVTGPALEVEDDI